MDKQNAINILRPKGYSMKHLKQARNILVKQFHPDVIGDAGTEINKMVLEAYVYLFKYVDKCDFQNIHEVKGVNFDKTV